MSEQYSKHADKAFSNETIMGQGFVTDNPKQLSVNGAKMCVVVTVATKSAAWSSQDNANRIHTAFRQLKFWGHQAAWVLDNIQKGDYVTYSGNLSYSEYDNPKNGYTSANAVIDYNAQIGLAAKPFADRSDNGENGRRTTKRNHDDDAWGSAPSDEYADAGRGGNAFDDDDDDIEEEAASPKRRSRRSQSASTNEAPARKSRRRFDYDDDDVDF